MERGEGRNRSEIPDLDARLLALDEELEDGELPDRTLLFNVEAYAWTILLRLRAEIFERRYEMPKNDAEVFTILQRNEVLDQAEARRIRQFCEARHLSSRDIVKIDVAGVREMISDRTWIRDLLKRLEAKVV